MLYILINIFSPIKIKIKGFGFSYYSHISFHYYNDVIAWLQTNLVILLCWYKRYSIFLISFVNWQELFAAFICANNIGSLVSSLFGVNVFNISFSYFISSLSPSNADISDKSADFPLPPFSNCISRFSILKPEITTMFQETIQWDHICSSFDFF